MNQEFEIEHGRLYTSACIAGSAFFITKKYW